MDPSGLIWSRISRVTFCTFSKSSSWFVWSRTLSPASAVLSFVTVALGKVLVVLGLLVVPQVQSHLTKGWYCNGRVSEEAARGRAACPSPVLWHNSVTMAWAKPCQRQGEDISSSVSIHAPLFSSLFRRSPSCPLYGGGDDGCKNLPGQGSKHPGMKSVTNNFNNLMVL